jgi:murein L,D-transpeptidase YcbB/YkuD
MNYGLRTIDHRLSLVTVLRTFFALPVTVTRLCTGIHTLVVSIAVLSAAAACQDKAAGRGGPAARSRYADSQPNDGLRTLIQGSALKDAVALPRMDSAERSRLADQVKRFYDAENYQLIWIDGDKPSNRYRQLLKVLDVADEHGLPRELYKVPIEDPQGEKVRIPAESAAKLDVQTTSAFFRYFMHLTAGRLDPHALESQWTLKPNRPELVAALTDAVEHDRLIEVMERLKPASPQYGELQKALLRYRKIAEKGGWPAIVNTKSLKPGAASPVVSELRRRLAIEGDFVDGGESEPAQAQVYDPSLVEAVKRFQERHQLKADGIVTPQTIAAMNVPVGDRIRTIELNLERWRWLPDTMPDRYLLVNVPGFHLYAIEHERPVLDMRVVVGAPDKKTPIFADEMTTVIFSPYWNVPPDIAREETAPRAAQDPGYLERNNMEVIDARGGAVDPYSIDWSNTEGLRIRQRPGTGNALGGVKFVFPNNFNVYLHDTNAGKLFDRVERGLSHGCVRVEEPAKLAEYVLRDQPEWTPQTIADAMQAGKERAVKLKQPLPVYIVYMTASVHNGGVRFVKDVYGHDREQASQLWPDPS